MSNPPIPREEIVLRQEDLKQKLLPHLLNRVFHVTHEHAFVGIQTSGAVSSNHDGRFPSTYHFDPPCYGQYHSCVCLCDLRAVDSEAVERALDCFNFLDPRRSSREDPVFLVLDPNAYSDLIPNATARTEGYTHQFVPQVETWYPGDLPTSLISIALFVSIQRLPDDPLIAAHRARKGRAQ